MPKSPDDSSNNQRRIGFLAAACVLLLVLGGVFGGVWAGWFSRSNNDFTLTQFSENDVSVEIKVRKISSGHFTLLGIFTPIREHFHLYSKDLPENGLDGLGRPTLLKVVFSPGLTWTGPSTADQSVTSLYYKTLGLSFPVYPEGPLTLRFPFTGGNQSHPLPLELSVTYMACSDQICLPPVINKHLDMNIPAEIFK